MLPAYFANMEIVTLARGLNQVKQVIVDRIIDRHFANRLLQLHDLRAVEHRFQPIDWLTPAVVGKYRKLR